ncbi:MAG: hypothetical protein KU38_04475 [Sulfurovum sp. FS08-3]|nr:MAG: hypothetical protein KU38_04475 [Sulfurovum sp. FS08-3]
MKEKIEIEFETITPIWTGDAWSENSELKATAIMGSLRFWFEVYCHFAGIEVKEKEELDYGEFIKQRKKIENIDKSDDEILSDMKVTLVSRIFGCTGWKSRIEIEKISFQEDALKKNDIDFTFLHENEENDTKWWCNTTLFEKKESINTLKNIQVTFLLSENCLNEFQKFLKFYQDKPILIGGKKAFGLGFAKLKSDQNFDHINEITIKNKDYVIWDKVENFPSNGSILGYNIKHYLRQKENKKFRVQNFGKMSQASEYYFSSIVDNTSYIITFKNNHSILNKYKKWLQDKFSTNRPNQRKSNQADLMNHFNSR